MPNTIKQHNYPHTAKLIFEERDGGISAAMMVPLSPGDQKDTRTKKIEISIPFLVDVIALKPDKEKKDGDITARRLKKRLFRFNNVTLISFFCGPGIWIEIPRKSLREILHRHGILPAETKH